MKGGKGETEGKRITSGEGRSFQREVGEKVTLVYRQEKQRASFSPRKRGPGLWRGIVIAIRDTAAMMTPGKSK